MHLPFRHGVERETGKLVAEARPLMRCAALAALRRSACSPTAGCWFGTMKDVCARYDLVLDSDAKIVIPRAAADLRGARELVGQA